MNIDQNESTHNFNNTRDQQPAGLGLLHQPSFTEKSAFNQLSQQRETTLTVVMAYNDLRRACNDSKGKVFQEETLRPPSLNKKGKKDALDRLKEENYNRERREYDFIKNRMKDELDFDQVMEQRKQLGYQDLNNNSEHNQTPNLPNTVT